MRALTYQGPDVCITHRFPLEQAPDAYRLFAQKRDGCVKCVLMPHGHA
ncbi:hypothetical protein [Corallococcus carmarthensis]|nr:hypothetical protein [Corallococcus carmarthensis]NOK18777.1 hypothetical protein [Corallococcus carmarthensis]